LFFKIFWLFRKSPYDQQGLTISNTTPARDPQGLANRSIQLGNYTVSAGGGKRGMTRYCGEWIMEAQEIDKWLK
jgi:hypothetical protein